MSHGVWYVGLELLQASIATVGLMTALIEWRAVRRLWRSGTTPPQRVLARHAAFIEVLRLSVHVVILGTAAIALALPTPPDYMPHWITEALIARKIGFLWVTVIACAGTVSSRRARLAFARAVRQSGEA